MKGIKRLNRKYRKVRKYGTENDLHRFQSEVATITEKYTADLINKPIE